LAACTGNQAAPQGPMPGAPAQGAAAVVAAGGADGAQGERKGVAG
jgi:hypothetical protein